MTHAADLVPTTRGIRDQSMKEMVKFVQSKIDQNSLILLAGDFNIQKYPFNEVFLAKLFGSDGNFVNYLS